MRQDTARYEHGCIIVLACSRDPSGPKWRGGVLTAYARPAGEPGKAAAAGAWLDAAGLQAARALSDSLSTAPSGSWLGSDACGSTAVDGGAGLRLCGDCGAASGGANRMVRVRPGPDLQSRAGRPCLAPRAAPIGLMLPARQAPVSQCGAKPLAVPYTGAFCTR